MPINFAIWLHQRWTVAWILHSKYRVSQTKVKFWYVFSHHGDWWSWSCFIHMNQVFLPRYFLFRGLNFRISPAQMKRVQVWLTQSCLKAIGLQQVVDLANYTNYDQNIEELYYERILNICVQIESILCLINVCIIEWKIWPFDIAV